MGGRPAKDSYYSHTNIGTFAVTVSGSPASLAADILATGFAASQTAWQSFFGAQYPKIPDSAMCILSAGSTDSGFKRVASTGVTFATEVLKANAKTQLFINDLSLIQLQSADGTLRIEW